MEFNPQIKHFVWEESTFIEFLINFACEITPKVYRYFLGIIWNVFMILIS